MTAKGAHRLCRPPTNVSGVRRWTGKRWVNDDGKPGLAFSGESLYTKKNGQGSSYPTAWASACKGGCGLKCVKWRAMNYTARRFGAANGVTVRPCNKEK